MSLYTTKYVKNLETGESFVVKVPKRILKRMRSQIIKIRSGENSYFGTTKELIVHYELSFFPAYKQLLTIFFENGYTDELVAQILSDFGATTASIQKILEDEKCVAHIKPWFEGIACDGERSARTLGIVYSVAEKNISSQKPVVC